MQILNPQTCLTFAVLARLDEEPEACAVCGRSATEHESPGIRLLTGGEIRTERAGKVWRRCVGSTS